MEMKLKKRISIFLLLYLFIINNVFASNDEDLSFYSEIEEDIRTNPDLIERNEELSKEGWTLISSEIVLASRLVNQNNNEDHKIENTRATVLGYYIVINTYTQPIKQNSYTNNILLSGIINYANPISTLISIGLPKYRWVPRAVGFLSSAIASASANSLSTFQTADTLILKEVMVNTDMTNGYCSYAEAQRYCMAAGSLHSGYTENGTPFTNTTSKNLDVKSSMYDLDSTLITIGCARAAIYADTPFIDPYVLPLEF